MSATDSDGRGTLPISAHATYDAAVALVLVGAAVVFGVAGEIPALVLLLAAGVAQLTLNGFTRYAPSQRLKTSSNERITPSLERPRVFPPGPLVFQAVVRARLSAAPPAPTAAAASALVSASSSGMKSFA